VRFGVVLPQNASADLARDVVEVARTAEESGYDSLWVYERVLFPLAPTDGLYGQPGAAWPDTYRSTADPLTVLTAAAAVTERVRLGTAVLIAGLHGTHQLACRLATVDQLSGGRVVAGLGGGWSSDEFRATGGDFAHRGRALDETIDGLTALWGPDPVTYRDSRMRIDNALVSPKPVGRIPILLGGGYTAKAADRIARKADGWLASGLPVPALLARFATIRERAEGYGRDPAGLSLVALTYPQVTEAAIDGPRAPFQGSLDQIVDELGELAAGGAHEVIFAFGPVGGAELITRARVLLAAVTAAGLHHRA